MMRVLTLGTDAAEAAAAEQADLVLVRTHGAELDVGPSTGLVRMIVDVEIQDPLPECSILYAFSHASHHLHA